MTGMVEWPELPSKSDYCLITEFGGYGPRGYAYNKIVARLTIAVADLLDPRSRWADRSQVTSGGRSIQIFDEEHRLLGSLYMSGRATQEYTVKFVPYIPMEQPKGELYVV